MEKCGKARKATFDNVIRCMRRACWIPKATDTHSDSVILINFALQQWVGESASIRLYVYFLSCYFIQMIQQMNII